MSLLDFAFKLTFNAYWWATLLVHGFMCYAYTAFIRSLLSFEKNKKTLQKKQ